MVADEAVPEAMLHQPRIAVGAAHAVAAGAAERERRIAAPVQEQQCLLAALDRLAHRRFETRRDPASARRRRLAQIDGFERRDGAAAEALGQRQPLVAPAPRIDLGLERRRGRGEHDRRRVQPRAHHRHVARVIVHAVFLLVGRVVLLIDDDEAELLERQKQRRARPGDDLHFAARHRLPGARALARRDLRMPFGRPCAEALGEAVEKAVGERDLRQQDQRLLAAAQGFGDRLEIDLGLARAGDAVEQMHRELGPAHRLAQHRGGRGLHLGEHGARMLGIGRQRNGFLRQHDRFERAFVQEPVDRARRHGSFPRRLGLGAHQPIGEQPQARARAPRSCVWAAAPRAGRPRAAAPRPPPRRSAAPCAAPCRAAPACSRPATR